MSNSAATAGHGGGELMNDPQYAALNQKVFGLEATFGQRFSGIESSINTLATQLSNLGTKLDTRSQTPWGVIWAAAGVCVGILIAIGGLVYTPVAREQERVSGRIERLADIAASDKDLDKVVGAVAGLSASTVSKADLDARFATGNARRDDWQRSAEKATDENRADIVRLRSDVVPRSENAEHWLSTDHQVADLQRQIDETKKFQSELYSARDIIKDLNERTKTLEHLVSPKG